MIFKFHPSPYLGAQGLLQLSYSLAFIFFRSVRLRIFSNYQIESKLPGIISMRHGIHLHSMSESLHIRCNYALLF